MTEPNQYVLEIARTLVKFEREKSSPKITSALLREKVLQSASSVNVQLDDEEVSRLVRELESIYTTWIDVPRTLEDGSHKPWLPKKMTEIEWFFWDRYKRYLVEQGWAEATLNNLDFITQDTLGRLEDPHRYGAWDVRGMVVGHVQSGKTANYIGLICRAIDAGYKVIVVLAGIHNSLRSQTQIRLDEGLLGFDSVHNLDGDRGNRDTIGAGKIAHGRPIDTITTRMEEGDFRTAVAKQFNINPGGNPLLFVIKKNGTVLRNLIEWVEWAARGNQVDNGRPLVKDVPLLVIDDEADYGSVDTRKQKVDLVGKIDDEHNPTVINARIRQLLFYFEKSAYIGYTATPFANIYIHDQSRTKKFGDDLFPRNFITLLPAPSNYIGPSRVFGIHPSADDDIEEVEGLPVVRLIDDTNQWMPNGHKPDHIPMFDGKDQIPPSLSSAIKSFILSCAARKSRGQENVHNSMLIHVTRYIKIQAIVLEQVRNELANIQRRLREGDGDRFPSLLDELKNLWETDFESVTREISDPLCQPLSWSDISSHILSAALAISQVREINGSSGEVLDYIEHRDSGLNVIAVGGDKLSRGLTLEGLTTSYFLRTSKMYDTLMQMGRWFGYRPGYLDLCRLYTTQELRDWLRHITFANEELHQEFVHMEDLRAKPKEYGLRVRSHPNLLVTAPVKMRHGTRLEISFAGSICETVVFHKNAEAIQQNYEATKNLLERLTSKSLGPEAQVQTRHGRGSYKGSGACWKNVVPEEICRFLREYSTHEDARKVHGGRLSEYIEKQAIKGYLIKWTVYLASGSGASLNWPGVEKLSAVARDWHPEFNPDKFGPQPFFRIRRLLSPSDESVDISAEDWEIAMKETQKGWEEDQSGKRNKQPEYPSGYRIRSLRSPKNGLLLLYPLEPTDTNSEIGPSGPPIVGFGISFPGNSNDQKISYVVNRVFMDQEYGDLE